MKNVFSNLKELKADMESKGWCIDSFEFHYKEKPYVVLIKLYQEDEKRPQYALVKMEFVAEDDNSIIIPSNVNGFMTEFKSIVEIKNFFGVGYKENLGVYIKQFQSYVAEFIPREVIEKKSANQERCMVNSLSKSDGEDVDKVFCYKVRRNPYVNKKQQERTVYNDNKTRIKRPSLYETYKIDKTISFCYTADPAKEKEDGEIRLNFAKSHVV